MAWTTRQFSKGEVNRAGEVLIDGSATEEAMDHALLVINNWRSAHGFPLNTFQVTLRWNARRVDSNALVAQRIKRLSSIAHKLERFPQMNLSQMQDIGGCRAVVPTVAKVDELRRLYSASKMRHRYLREDDYIRSPKDSGYRGLHLIYRYLSERAPDYNGLLVEVQLRSRLQHAWATAVETVGTFLRQALKSSQGEEPWLRFFALMGSEIAFRERGALVPGTPHDRALLRQEIATAARELEVADKLNSYRATLSASSEPEGKHIKYFLLELVPRAGNLAIRGYTSRQLGEATAEYLRIERAIKDSPGAEAVLVSVDSLSALRKAYPNYFLDTAVFVKAMREAIGK